VTVKFQPLTDHLLLTLEPEPELSGVIAVQRSLVGLTRFATVVSVGPEVRDSKPGDRVLASITAGTELPWGMLVSEQAILSHVL
jgi:hypothetical protein